jgi:hypothetical protein
MIFTPRRNTNFEQVDWQEVNSPAIVRGKALLQLGKTFMIYCSVFFPLVHVFHCYTNIHLTKQTPSTTHPASNNLSKLVKGTILKSL